MPKPSPLHAPALVSPLLVALALPPLPTASAQQPPVREEHRPRAVRIERDVPEPPAPSGGVVAVERDYRRALLQLAAGRTEAARAAALELDRELPPPPSDRRATHDQAAVLDRLAQRDPEALLPALLLHVELYRHHRAERSYRRIEHHAGMIERAAGLYAVLGGTETASEQAAEALAALGLGLLEDRHGTDARRVLARALEIDPDQPAALLGLATDHERHGRYRESVETLERLVAVRPESSEARLRLAVNLARTGRWRDAEAGYQALIDDRGADGWASVIAYQELAEARLRNGDPAAAIRLLRRGVDRFPDADRLRLQLAFALERAGQPAEARQTIEELARRPAPPPPSPRERYNRSPEAATVLALAGLAAPAAERLGALRAALDAMAEDDPR